MATTSYISGWLIYIVGALGFLFIAWRVSDHWSRWVRFPLRAVLVPLLLFPWSAMPDKNNLAPAVIVSLFDAFAREEISGLRAGKPLLVVVVFAFVMGLVVAWVHTRKSLSTAGLSDNAHE